MKATPNSNIFKVSEIGIIIKIKVEVAIEHENDLKRYINKCPAVIFAISRTDKVIGRIRFLIISIITMIGMRGDGEPIGTMWENIKLVFLNIKYIILAVHRVNLMGKIIDICDVNINIDGIIEIMFIIKIDINNGIRKLFLSLLEVSLLNSFWIKLFIFLIGILNLDEFLKIGEKINIIGIIQFSDIKKLHGSNIENKFVIIGCLIFYYLI